VASRLGTSRRQISDIETGKRIPRDDEIGALAGLYGADRATRRQLAQVTADLRDEPAPARAVITRPERPSETVAADLRRRIAAEEWAVDDPLPPVGGLAAHYGVSRSTVTRAMRVLAGEGLVRIVPRWGTFRAGGNS
jgi:transcriptional regulator with XRE-family HTH domain